jgi:hypothetical protein
MHGKHAAKESGIGIEGTHYALPQRTLPIKSEHELGHESWTPRQSSVPLLITSQIAGGEALSQCLRLMKCKAQAFAGDGIKRARGVADKGNPALIDLSQLSG